MQTIYRFLFTTVSRLQKAQSAKRSSTVLSICTKADAQYLDSENAVTLKGLSANVSVFTDNAEESARASVIADKSFPLKSLSDHAGDFRFIFNTVPAQFINEETLKNVDLSALIIDIASSPGGVDYDAAQRLGISALHCLGLPGKYAPASSARHLKQFIESKLYLS